MTDPNTRRTPTESNGERRPIRRGLNWGAIVGWLIALIVAWYLLSLVLGNRAGDEQDRGSAVPTPTHVEFVLRDTATPAA